MVAVKEAFLARDALSAVVGLLPEPLSHHPAMSHEDALTVQLVITFLRNLLIIPDTAPDAGIFPLTTLLRMPCKWQDDLGKYAPLMAA